MLYKDIERSADQRRETISEFYEVLTTGIQRGRQNYELIEENLGMSFQNPHEYTLPMRFCNNIESEDLSSITSNLRDALRRDIGYHLYVEDRTLHTRNNLSILYRLALKQWELSSDVNCPLSREIIISLNGFIPNYVDQEKAQEIFKREMEDEKIKQLYHSAVHIWDCIKELYSERLIDTKNDSSELILTKSGPALVDYEDLQTLIDVVKRYEDKIVSRRDTQKRYSNEKWISLIPLAGPTYLLIRSIRDPLRYKDLYIYDYSGDILLEAISIIKSALLKEKLELNDTR